MLVSLLGTKHMPDAARIKGGVLFLEDVNEHPYRVERHLLHLHQAGVLARQKAVVLGAFSAFKPTPLDRGYNLKAVVQHLRSVCKAPILTGLPFGHVHPKVTLPVGAHGAAAGAGARRAHRLVMLRRCLVGAAAGLVAAARGLQQQPLARRLGGHQHAVLGGDRELAAPPRPHGLVLEQRHRVSRTRSTSRLYGYHYLKRPFVLVPKTAAAVVQPKYLDKDGKPLPDRCAGRPGGRERVRHPDQARHPVPAAPGLCSKDGQGRYRYHAMKPGELGERRTPLDFEHQGTRELVAEDFVYALKRHATTRITTPIFGLFAEYVVGLKDYGKLIKAEDAKLRAGPRPVRAQDKPFLDFRQLAAGRRQRARETPAAHPHQGQVPAVELLDADDLPGPGAVGGRCVLRPAGHGRAVGLTLDVWPVGTGPYMMTEYVKDRRHVMKRNPNYRGEPYPCEGMPGDKEAGPAGRLRQAHRLSSTRWSPPSSARPCRSAASSARASTTSRSSSAPTPAWTTWWPRRTARTCCASTPTRASASARASRRQQLLHRLQHARPGAGRGRGRRQHARAEGERNRKLRQALLHRDRLGGVQRRSFPRRRATRR